MGHDPDPRFNSSDAELIRHKVRRIIGRYGFRRDDEEDLQQTLAMHVATQVDRYDPSRGARSTFVDRIVGNKLANLVEYQRAQKRGARRCTCAINDDVEDFIADSDFDGNDLDTRLDVAAAIATLPADLRRVALCLMSHTPSEAERVLGMTRGQVRHRMGLIAKHLAEISFISSDPNNQPERRSGR